MEIRDKSDIYIYIHYVRPHFSSTDVVLQELNLRRQRALLLSSSLIMMLL